MSTHGRCCIYIDTEAVCGGRIIAIIVGTIIGLDREIICPVRKIGNRICGYIPNVDICSEYAGRCSVIEPITRKVSEGASINIRSGSIPG